MEAALQAVIQKLNKKFGSGTIVVGSEINRPFIQRISSGSSSLDAMLNGGWPTNHWSEISGQESAGKTFLVLKTIAVNQKKDPNWTVAWFATEDFSESYAKMIGCDLNRIIVTYSNVLEDVYDAVLEFLRTQTVDCVVIDSLPALVPKREIGGSMEDLQPGFAAFLNGKFFRIAGYGMGRSVTMEQRPVTGFIINQWRESIGRYGDPRVSPGGKAKNFAYFIRVDVRRDEWISNSKGDPVGQTLQIVNVKNKQGPPRRKAFLDIYFADWGDFKAGDVDTVKDTINAARAYEAIRSGGGGYYYFGGEKWKGMPALEEALRSSKALHRRLHQAVLKAASQKDTPKVEPEEAPKRRRVPRG